MAREVYVNGRKERDTDYLRTMLFLQTKLKVVCITVVGWHAGERQVHSVFRPPRKFLRVKPKASDDYRYPRL